MEKFVHIGLVAAGKRDILPGSEYDHLFPVPDFSKTIVDRNGDVEDTMLRMGEVLGKYYHDTKKIAPMLVGKTIEQTCKNIFDFIFNHIQYELDKPGEEQLRRPARSWFDRKTGVDCDCYSIFAGSVLMNLGIPFKLRITKYEHRPHYQHVYVIVPHGSGYYTIDPVLNQFNYEKQFTGHKDFTMENLGIPIAVLHGVDDTEPTNTIIDDLLSGVGETSNEQEIFDHLVATRNTILDNPGIIDTVDYTPGFLQMLNYAIDNFWKGQEVRDKAFYILALNEAQINEKMGITEDDLLGLDDEDDEYLNGIYDNDLVSLVDDDEIYPFDGLGKAKKTKTEKKQKRQEKRQEKQQKKAEKKAEKAQKKTDKKEEKQTGKKERQQERKEAKGFFRKVGVTLKQGGKAFVKYNPVVVAARNGFLLALRLNMFKMASRLKWAYVTPEQAQASGISAKKQAASKRALAKVEKLFADKLQGSKVSLKNAVLSGKHNIAGFDDDYVEFAGLGMVEEGVIAAAIPIILEVVSVLSEEMGPVEEEEGETEVWDDVEEIVEDDLGSLFKKIKSGVQKVFKKDPNKNSGSGKVTKKASKIKNKSGGEKKKWLQTAFKKIVNLNQNKVNAANADVQKEFAEMQSQDVEKSYSDDYSGSNDNNILNIIKANPIPAALIGFGLAYAFIPPVRNGVNNMLGFGRRKQPVNGLGKLPQKGKYTEKIKTIQFK